MRSRATMRLACHRTGATLNEAGRAPVKRVRNQPIHPQTDEFHPGSG